MQEYGRLALAIATQNNLDIDEHLFDQPSENSFNDINHTDVTAWNKLVDGDKQALGDLYDQFIDVLFSYGMYHARDRGYVMDCIHDLFLDLYKYRKNLSVTANVKYYLFKSLRRKINKKYRVKESPVSNEQFQFRFEGNKKNHIASCEEKIIGEEHIIERNESLLKALKTLTKNQQQVLFLRYNEDKTYEEISEIMNISIETARTSIYRAIKKLRKLNFSY
jgi:RNA polymerase sigma-70 factor (ECF subfamily)